MQRIYIFIFTLLWVCSLFSQEEYTVKQGDTLYSISKIYGVDIEKIKELNGINDISALKVGEKLILTIENNEDSDKNSYKIEKGDTLFSISRKFNLSLSKLLEYNDLDSDDIISQGQVLKLTGEGVDNQSEKIDSVGVEITAEDVAAAVDDVKGVPYWPLRGDISQYSGRIKGVIIEGNSGDYIHAVSTGRVIWYDSYKGIGKVVLIEGDNGFEYLYGATDSFNVSMNKRVDAGDKLGRLKEGNTSVIFSVFKNGKPINDISKAPR